VLGRQGHLLGCIRLGGFALGNGRWFGWLLLDDRRRADTALPQRVSRLGEERDDSGVPRIASEQLAAE
jgi:hypothetical protein